MAATLALGPALPARANDTTAHLDAGGLIFVQNDVVEMKSEDLFISTEEVRVRYVFRNTTKEDQKLLVAFPMPDIALSEGDLSIPDNASDNFLDFKTTVDGKPVTTELEQKAIALTLDRTEVLRKLNIPLAPYKEGVVKALDALPADKGKELVAMGLVSIDEFDAGKGWERHYAPRWTLRSTYYWTQTFPTGRDIVVEHRYKPSVGGSAGTLVGYKSPDMSMIENEQRQMAQTYCIDKTFLSAVDRATKAQKDGSGPPFSDLRVHYILKTGANWSGPIGDFKLTVDKGKPENLVSFCGKDVKKISPTQFQMTAKDFWPTQDLGILILLPHPKL
ncbi:hypothetical protein GCM10007301_20180 [Azorhizobium oxalatiphilum]|uniref:DUF4424 domain-containing protein n=1 Tax=Azorhizobium oxalatiphilum TaxID=980631 RepID=A0A917FAG8_9HYPH|nr:hypothetical protein GCM10007301_20180 [Azorhizobium oxalatiphilum]